MNKSVNPTSCYPSLRNLSFTIAELCYDGVRETIATGMEEWEWDKEKVELEGQGVFYVPETRIPGRINPFDGSLVIYDKLTSRLLIHLCLSKPLKVIAEIYSLDGSFIKRLFKKQMKIGLTEIVEMGCRQREKVFIVVLNSNEGSRSFKVKHNYQLAGF